MRQPRLLLAGALAVMFLGVVATQCIQAALRVGDVREARARLVADPPAARIDAFSAYDQLLSLRPLAEHVREGDRFVLVVGDDVDEGLALQLVQYAYYPARRVDDLEAANVVITVGVASGDRPAGFTQSFVAGDAWLGRRAP